MLTRGGLTLWSADDNPDMLLSSLNPRNPLQDEFGSG
jgi:hypothetical protein